MKYADLEKIREAGFITEEQQVAIAEHFDVRPGEGRSFLTIVSFLGAVLLACGVVLLISANWESIHKGIKIAAGIGLLVGSYAGGYYLREKTGSYPKTGEALYLAGAGLFLGNIALIGQIYHLSSRAPNAFLLWWAGIALLPFILRSKALHVASLVAFCIWFGMELNDRTSVIYYGDERQLLLYALLGLSFIGLSYLLRRTSFSSFSAVTANLGLVGLIGFSYPLSWNGFYHGYMHREESVSWLFPALLCIAAALALAGTSVLKNLNRQWRVTWGVTLMAFLGMLAAAHYIPYARDFHLCWLSSLLLFVFSLIMIQVSVQLRSHFMLNAGIAFIALIILSSYINLFGSMTQTGLVFLIGGVFLLAMGVYLEKKRRGLLREMKSL